jgi:hypothetical protein
VRTSGAVSGRLWWASNAAFLLISSFVLISCTALVVQPKPTPTAIVEAEPPEIIKIQVLDLDNKPIKRALVRVTGTSQVDDDDNAGYYVQSCIAGQYVAASAPGYEIGFTPCDGSNQSYSVQLKSLNKVAYDNPSYVWQSAYGNCSPCHAGQFGAGYNELPEWESSAHAKVFTDPYFETMYRGIDIGGVSGPVTQWLYMGNQLVRQVDSTSTSYKGPGFQLDFPGQAGDCAFCHAPAAVSPVRAQVDLSYSSSSNGDLRSEGITCDVCHKVNAVILADNKYPYPDKPGVLSFQLLRMDTFTTGPFANVILPNSSLASHTQSMCASIFSSSDFCAACHYGKFDDMLIYNSYGEWKKSSFAENPGGDGYRTCQDCHMSHMKSDDKTPFSRRSACSETTSAFQDFNHNMMDFGRDDKLGRDIPRMIRGAAKLRAVFDYQPDKSDSLKVNVTVTNKNVGHKFPTDSPLRHLILVLDAKDQFGNSILQIDGPQIPNWGGINNAYMESGGVKGYAGLPGKIFANLLIEKDTNISPSAAYWNETKPAQVTKDGIASDTRLGPGAKNVSAYYFSVPYDGEVRFTISLIYRYGFYDLMQQKRWVETGQRADIPVVVMECSGNVNNADQIDCEQTDP